MSKTATIILIVAAGFVFLLAAMVFLLWLLKERIVPEKADFPDDALPEEDDEPQYQLAARQNASFRRPEPEPEYDGPEEDDMESDASFEPQAPSAYSLEDILASGYFIGRTPAECLVPTSCLSEDRTEILTEGGLFGAYAYGGITLSPDEAGVKRADSFYVICRELDYDSCRENLADLFGGPASEGNDEDSGTVYSAFDTEWGTLWLSHGSGNDYLNLNLVRD
ncbi:MAG: hypothetical protein IKR59_08740 [Lachnospiraceae bacterium]|nr:hypothetical protein [Lachnospiraceae bacterium]